jgi:hypothetical protein
MYPLTSAVTAMPPLARASSSASRVAASASPPPPPYGEAEEAGGAHLLEQPGRRPARGLRLFHRRPHVAVDERPHARPEVLVRLIEFPGSNVAHGAPISIN